MAAGGGTYEYDFLLAYEESELRATNKIREQILQELESEPNKQKGYDLLRDSPAGKMNDICHLSVVMDKSRHVICLMTESCVAASPKIYARSLFVQLAHQLLLRRNKGGSVIPLFNNVSSDLLEWCQRDPDHPLYSLMSIIGHNTTDDENWLTRVKMQVQT